MCLDPLKEIQAMRKRRNYSKPIAYLVLASVLIGISAGLGFNILQGSLGTIPATPMVGPAGVGVSAAIVVFFVGLFVSWIFTLGMNVLGGKGNFYEGLICIVYPLKLLSIGIVISAVFSLLGPVSLLVSFVALGFFGILGYTALFRATKEVFRVDMITAFIGVTALFAVLMLAFYGATIFGVMTSIPSYMPATM